MKRLLIYSLLLPIWVTLLPRHSAQAQAPQAVVHAVLFYSPTCGHCQYVITNTLIPMLEQYGGQLAIVGIDVTTSSGGALFQTALQHFNLESSGVPFLVIDSIYLVGSEDIPEKFPLLVEEYLALGGVDWPAIPGLSELIASSEATQAAQPAPTAQVTAATQVTSATQVAEATPVAAVTQPAPASTTVTSSTPTQIQPTPALGLQLAGAQGHRLGARFASDPVGNSLAVVVLAGMIISLFGAALAWRAKPGAKSGKTTSTWRWLIPLLCLVGIGVAGYLAYVETTQVEAVCGPVGDCNTVQQSQYARLFGFLPIGFLGIVGYILILLAWGGASFGQVKLAAYAHLALLGLATFGVLFSIYLTFLEPFVIGATCAWCLTSAIIMTALLWLSLAPARAAYRILHLQD
jgi:uncharacterized membrane protein/thiol-disulfide isomerase/thioredoxin